ncbi:uncharacterized protein [Miscanthus floridulus]|uniref:uncharacterized protein n=1 Tax=Miscanthus floridulus TaxID=154761 RepID=UPI0034594264
MAPLPTRRRPGALLLLLLVGLALAVSFSCAHAVRVPAALQDGGTEAAHQGQAPAGSGAVPLEHAAADKQVHDHEHVSEGVMRVSSGSGGGSEGGSGSRSSSGSSGGSGSCSNSGSSGGSGSRSGSGSSGGGSRSRSDSGSKGSGSRSGGGSRGGGSSRSGGGSRGTTNYDSVLDSLMLG